MKQQRASGWKRKDPFDESDRLGNAAKKKIGSKRVVGKFLRNCSGGEQRAEFGSKGEAFGGLPVVERLDAQGIASEKKNRHRGEMLAQVEQSERKHAAQLGQQVF